MINIILRAQLKLVFDKITFNFYCHNKYIRQMKKTNHKNTTIGQYTILNDQIIGRGATSTVFKGYATNSSEIFAIKVIDHSQHCDVAQQSLLENQCKVLKQLNHPNLIKLINIMEINKKFYIVSKFYEGYTLSEYLQRNILTNLQISFIFSKILEAVTYLINKNILHRDLKPANIIIDKQLNPIIIDFGYSEIISQTRINRVFNVGTPSYMAPQAYLRTLFSEKSQSWSLAMILYEMLNKQTLDKGIPIQNFYQKIRSDSNFLNQKLSKIENPQFKEILFKSFMYNSMERMSITGMKYLIDLFIIKNKKQQDRKVLDLRSPANFNCSKQIINFQKNDAPFKQKITQFGSLSPIKVRQTSVKFIQVQQNQYKDQETNEKRKIKYEQAQQQIHKHRKTDSYSAQAGFKNKNSQYFANKIKKGVFDMKRFSKNEKVEQLIERNLEKYHQLSIKQL